MSHTTAIENIQISSIPAFRAAVQEMNRNGIKCDLIQNSVPRAYYQNQQGLGKADYVLVLHDAPYDVGLYAREDGTYEARTDLWNNNVAKVLGVQDESAARAQSALGKMYSEYAVQATVMQANDQGYTAQVQRMDDGSATVRVSGY